jgi:hypothetical protein
MNTFTKLRRMREIGVIILVDQRKPMLGVRSWRVRGR